MAVQEAEELQVSNTRRATKLREDAGTVVDLPRTVIVDGLMNLMFPTPKPRDSIEGPTKVPDRL